MFRDELAKVAYVPREENLVAILAIMLVDEFGVVIHRMSTAGKSREHES